MNYKHGHSSRTRVSGTYHSWASMKSRCNDIHNIKYHLYGGRGISYDKRWEIFTNFLDDMGEKPYNKTLDRIDTNKNYCKENCRWATILEQNFNTNIRKDNTSGVRGVCFKKQIKRWISRCKWKGEETLLYCGKSFEAACEARK